MYGAQGGFVQPPVTPSSDGTKSPGGVLRSHQPLPRLIRVVGRTFNTQDNVLYIMREKQGSLLPGMAKARRGWNVRLRYLDVGRC